MFYDASEIDLARMQNSQATLDSPNTQEEIIFQEFMSFPYFEPELSNIIYE